MTPFGEKVRYKQVRENKECTDRFECEWEQGIWLGRARDLNETITGTPAGAIRAYVIRRMDEDDRWDGEAVCSLKGTPQQPDPN